MAHLQNLINKIDDETLRQQIMTEVGKLTKQKKFGLVFEEHLPECTPLYDVEIRRDSKVALKTGQVSDTIKFFVANKPNALIVDFFSGSGTTLHAVNMLNAEDNGHRRCIMVTNNEVSDAEAKTLIKQGHRPGDQAWNALGIARYVTWPRTVCSIEGHDVNGNPLKGNYLGSDIPMADGFKANAAFFKLGFLDKASVRIGRQFREMLPTLWMKAGCHGMCPILTGQKIPEYMVLPENHMAILNDNSCYAKFAEEVGNATEIETVYLVTDSDADYRSMSRGLNVKETYQLYRDYLDNFRINSRR